MLQEHDWIHSERQFFGQPNTPYDFKTNNPREAGQRLKKLEETTTKLERNVNKRAMNMLNEAEERVRSRGTRFSTALDWLHVFKPTFMIEISMTLKVEKLKSAAHLLHQDWSGFMKSKEKPNLLVYDDWETDSY